VSLTTYRTLEGDTTASSCLYLTEKYAALLMRAGGGGVVREQRNRTDAEKTAQRAQCAELGHGRINGRTKLSPEQVAVIRERRATGEPLKNLAFDFGVSLNWICQITNNRSLRRT
jgi:hypothetical protein